MNPPAHISRVYLIVAAIVAAVISLAVLGANNRQSPITKKFSVRFNHKMHVVDNGVACADCHTKAPTSKLSSDNNLATHENCQSCHEEQLKDKCAYCHTSEDQSTYAATALEERGLTFSHENHLGRENVKCETCHKDFDKMESLETVALPTMATCTTCHSNATAPAACEVCHTSMASLRPAEHQRTDFVRNHSRIARTDNAQCASCHSQESCADCHNGSDLKKVDVPGRILEGAKAPRFTAIDRGQGMRLTKMHDANFKFTHGVAAQTKAMECQTCHRTDDFCSTCHGSGTLTQLSVKPQSHFEAGFVTLGVGSGGGAHARLAKRDIEMCASCHGEQGSDPACITCHADADGIRGTDPKTHARGFMNGAHGDWHTDPGSICYTCHNDVNARPGGVRGQRFCGYCHS